MGTLVSGAMWNFRAYTLCVAECPASFGLTNTQSYGGPTYPGAAAGDKTFYSAFETVAIITAYLSGLSPRPSPVPTPTMSPPL